MAKANFSDPFVRNVSAPVRGQVSYWDEALPGFGLRVSQGGSKTWMVLDPRSRVRTQETIGRYPLISLSEARTEARRRLAEATLGKHRPRSQRWSKAVEDFLAEKKQSCKAVTHYNYKILLNLVKFGDTRLSDIAASDLEKKLAKETASMKHHTFVVLGIFFRWAYRKHYIAENPIDRMHRPPGSKKRKRVLSDDELREVWNACGEDRFGRLVKFLMLSGQRRGASASIEPKMLDGDVLEFPDEVIKGDRGFLLPLTPLMKELIGDGLSWGGFSKSKAELDERCGVEAWTLHDLRRTMRTNLGKLRVAPHIGERILNHKSGSEIEQIYDRWTYVPEMREALEKWEAHVLGLQREREFEAAA